jgi:hypothetical protein
MTGRNVECDSMPFSFNDPEWKLKIKPDEEDPYPKLYDNGLSLRPDVALDKSMMHRKDDNNKLRSTCQSLLFLVPRLPGSHM